jgi:Spy/CpxP family protein refolding chaperone
MKRFSQAMVGSMLVAALLMPCVAWAQGGPDRGGRSGPGGPLGGGITGLLQTNEVQKEIELMDDQRQELDAIAEEMRGELRGMFQGMGELSPEERRARFDEIRSRAAELQTKAEGKVQQVLLPHQFDRLKQIDLQTRIQRGGAAALSEGEMAEKLGLTEAQQEQLRERSAEVQQELQEKIRQLRLEARGKLMDVLSPEQRAKLETMLGEDFSLPDQPGGNRFFGRGGRGGRRGQGDANRGDQAPAAATDAPSSN